MKRETIMTIAGYAVGGLGGYLYYLAFPCEGGCTVTSSALITVMLGAFIGGFVFQFISEIITPKSSKNV
jgi:hypothetical protein